MRSNIRLKRAIVHGEAQKRKHEQDGLEDENLHAMKPNANTMIQKFVDFCIKPRASIQAFLIIHT